MRARPEQLGQRILSATDPKVFVRMETEELPTGTVLRIDVPPGDGPHLANGRAFMRSGPATVQLSRDEYERRLLERLRKSAGYERKPLTEAGFDDLDRDAIERFVEPGSVPTNPRIARALYLAGFVEEWGTGTLRVVSSMLAQGNGDPLFDASLGGGVRRPSAARVVRDDA